MSERSIFMAALDKDDPAERTAYLQAACGGDADLRRRVEELLAAHAEPGPSLEAPSFDADEVVSPQDLVPAGATATWRPVTEGPGTLIGPYKLLQRIGEGGMGTVFMAEQEKPVRRRVALKIIKPGMDSREVIARFEAERQALALMDHPNIARVLDAGTTDSGRPYFVMELVKGIPITQYCDEAHLTPRDRLELFVPVCQAIQHAHQKGIIHRDIKPSNVLVTLYDGRPVPKVIDFGVAKAIDQRLTERTIFTQFGAIVGTLEYMSPEQAAMSALDVDTRSDIYSLGVLLYELLTGTTPLEKVRLREVGHAEILRRIKEEEPPKPSTRLSHSGERLASLSAQRGTEPAKLANLVRGELDWIVMKCLEKDRTRRYETANGLARDIQRHMQDEPVEACPPSASYRLRKLARKHRGPLTTAAAFVGLLVVASVVSTILAIRATRAERQATADRNRALVAEAQATKERDRSLVAEAGARKAAAKAEAVSKFLLTDILSAMDAGRAGRAITLEEILRAAAVQVDASFHDQPDFAAEVHGTIGEVYLGLFQFDAAEPQLLAALETRRRTLGDEHRDTLKAMQRLGYCYRFRGGARRAEPLIRSTLETQRRVLGEDDVDTLESTLLLAMVFHEQNHLAEAESLLRTVLETQRRVLGETDQRTLLTMDNLTLVLFVQRRMDEAEALARKGLELNLRARGENHSDTASGMDALGMILLDQGKIDEAEALLRRAVSIQGRVLGEEHGRTATAMYHMADLLRRKSQWAEAEPLCRTALQNLKHVYGESGDLVLWATGLLANIRGNQNELVEAESLYRTVLEARRQKQSQPTQMWIVLSGLAQLMLRQGRPAEAEPFLRECLAILEKKAPDDLRTFNIRSLLGAALLGLRKYAEAEPLLIQGYEGLKSREAQLGEWKKLVPEAGDRIIQLYESWGKPEKVSEWQAKLRPPSEVGLPKP